jgi:hypothetical protein
MLIIAKIPAIPCGREQPMRKLILWLVGAAIALLGLLAAGSWLLGTLSRSNESYIEQQARIAREADSQAFWQSVVWVVLGAVLLLVLPVAIYLWGKAFDPFHQRAMEKARFQRDYNVLGYDQLGNGPIIFDRENMQLITTDQGNSPVPPTFVHGLLPTQLPPPGNKSRAKDLAIYANNQPNAYYRQQQSSSVRAIEMKHETTTEYQPAPPSVVFDAPEISEISPEVEASEISQPEISEDLDNLQPQLEAAIRRGETRTATFRALGVSGTSYQNVAQFYDKLFQQITGKPYKRGAGKQ